MTRKGIPVELQKPNPRSTASIVRGKQANSTTARQSPVNLGPKPKWEKETSND